MMMKQIFLSIFFLMVTAVAWGQQAMGIEGMIHVPTADMDTVGMARVGFQFVPKDMVPDAMKCDGMKFNSMTNFLSVTPFRWIELGYGYTLWKMHKNKNPKREIGFYSKDRYFSVKLQLLREGSWWPSLAVGGNDVFGSRDGGESASNYYRNYFVTASKHIDCGGHVLGAHVAYRKWKRDFNHKWNGVVGGVTYQPSFYTPLRAMAEWDGNGVNVGVDCRIYKYFLIQCGLQECQHFTGGLTLCIGLL